MLGNPYLLHFLHKRKGSGIVVVDVFVGGNIKLAVFDGLTESVTFTSGEIISVLRVCSVYVPKLMYLVTYVAQQ